MRRYGPRVAPLIGADAPIDIAASVSNFVLAVVTVESHGPDICGGAGQAWWTQRDEQFARFTQRRRLCPRSLSGFSESDAAMRRYSARTDGTCESCQNASRRWATLGGRRHDRLIKAVSGSATELRQLPREHRTDPVIREHPLQPPARGLQLPGNASGEDAGLAGCQVALLMMSFVHA